MVTTSFTIQSTDNCNIIMCKACLIFQACRYGKARQRKELNFSPKIIKFQYIKRTYVCVCKYSRKIARSYVVNQCKFIPLFRA